MAEFSAGGNDFSAAVFAFRSIQREMVDRERATVLLQEVASVCEPTTAVLSNKSFSEEASWMIGDQLGKYSSSLTSLDISDIIAGLLLCLIFGIIVTHIFLSHSSHAIIL